MKKIYLGGIIAFAALAALICMASAGYAKNRGHGPGGFTVAWGSVGLSNEQTFCMDEIRNVEIEYGSVNVVFGRADGDECVVKEYLRENGSKDGTEMKVEGDTLSIRRKGNYSTISIFGFGFGENGSEKVEIFLPEGYHGTVGVTTGSGSIGVDADFKLQVFHAASGSGNIRCQNVEAEEIEASAGSGSISFQRAEGNRAFSSGSGNIHVLGGAGDTSVSAGSGNISVEGAKGSFGGSSGSGNVNVSFEEVTGDISLETGSGSIKLEVPAGSGFTYEGSSVSGSIRTDFDGWLEWDTKGRKAKGSYGGGGVRIHTRASSGNITVTLG